MVRQREGGAGFVRVLVTGGTGYLGRAIVRELARRGHDPIVFSRRATATTDLPGTRIDGDVRDRDSVLAAARGVDAVCHTAALVRVWHPDAADFDRVNVGGLETVVDVCIALKTRRLLYTSSFLALPPAGRSRALEANDYQRSKVRAREVARTAAARGVPIVSLVPGVIYGPGAVTEGNLVGRLVRDHLAGRLPGIVGADRTWSFSFVDDVADAHVSALEAGQPGQEYVVGGENVPQIRLFQLLREIAGVPLPRRVPASVAQAFALIEELTAGRSRSPRLTRGTVKILQRDWPLDSSRSVQELSYRTTPLFSGIRTMLRRGF
ncbi:MAG: NAD-dependent epimerase/dehydratase family protein [Vicinamibacterales bacterium]